MSRKDETVVSDETREALREEYPDLDQPTDEEIRNWIEEAGAPVLDDTPAEADGGELRESTDE
jgi:hypothetical protein